ncbi:hypothetical protein HMI56_002236 [Coelomomyces lativittatus]|nr:hypothetical protein HMI56_002236 [Coelomomyces lativittatus]
MKAKQIASMVKLWAGIGMSHIKYIRSQDYPLLLQLSTNILMGRGIPIPQYETGLGPSPHYNDFKALCSKLGIPHIVTANYP